MDREPRWHHSCRGTQATLGRGSAGLRLYRREWCYYADWLVDGGRSRFYGHIDTSGDDVMRKALTMIAREIEDGLWEGAK